MGEKRFVCIDVGYGDDWYITDNGKRLSEMEIVDLLNEQQATIQRMKHSLNTIYKSFEKHYGYDMRNAIWLIDELSYDEMVDELHIAETDAKNRKESSMYWKKKCDEQQATIRKLQDLCGQSDSENAKLRIENKRLQEENEQLRKELKELENNYKDLLYDGGFDE